MPWHTWGCILMPHNENCLFYNLLLVVVSHVRLSATPWTAAHQASLSFSNSQNLLKLMSIELVMPSDRLILCHPRPFPQFFRVFSGESAFCIRWPKYWSFSFSISPSGEYSGLISLLFKGLSSLLQHHSLKASLLQC